MRLTFYGAAQMVTGSNYLLEIGSANRQIKVLVDCGMFQGSSDSEAKNYDDFPYDPAGINAVFLSHSHADHAGRLPKLYKYGFRGTVYATPPTLDMAALALPDSLSLLSREANKHEGHEALYSVEDVEAVLKLAQASKYGEVIDLGSGVKAILHDAGHILGSASIEIQAEGKRIYFSGDLGNPPTPLLKPFEFPGAADYIVVESCYGNRIHEDRATRKEKLRQVVQDSVNQGGVLMIPSFAIERTQELLYELHLMHNAGEIPDVPIYLDSPLAIRLTEIYKKYPDYFNQDAAMLIASGDLFKFPGLEYMLSTEDSKTINDKPMPKIIIAGSGMSSGGRILHHEQRYLPDPNSAILFIGFQAEGTLGRKIFDGRPEVKIFDEKIPVRCKVKAIGGYSSHADQPTLLKWVGEGVKGGNLKKVFVIHGESESAKALADKISSDFSVAAVAPTTGQSFDL